MRFVLILLFVFFSSEALAKDYCPSWASALGRDVERYESRMERAAEWIDEVKLVLESRHMPMKWIYLMLSESGGDRFAESKHGAVGPWQLTNLIAHKYGCYDRTDPTQSTVAAVMYIQKLLEDFNGDEAKVVMAYNMGGSNLRRKGKPTREAANLSALVMCLFKHDPLSFGDD